MQRILKSALIKTKGATVDVSNVLGSEGKLYRKVAFELNLREGGRVHQAGKAFHIE